MTTEYAVRILRGGGSSDGEVVEIFWRLAEAREYIDNPPTHLIDCVLGIYELTPCYDEGDEL